MSKNLSVPALQKKSRPDGRLEQSLKIWWRLLERGRDGVKPGIEAAADALDRTMITIEMPAAIRPYSIAVAPESSFRNARILLIGHIP